MKTTARFAIALMAAVAFLLAGCHGGGAEVTQHISTVSKGKELEDLKRALDMGAINQQEYEQLYQIVLRRRD